MRTRSLVPLVALLASASCHSAGLYGHAVSYSPLDDEAAAVAQAKEYDPVMYGRQPEEWRKSSVSLFGVVENRTAGPGGAAYLKLSVRRIEPRNLCENERDEDSCRVTVSDKDFGVVYALAQLHGDDYVGPQAVTIRSLVRVVGKFGEDVDPNDGAPILRASYVRHWPPFYYVTKSSAVDMRQ